MFCSEWRVYWHDPADILGLLKRSRVWQWAGYVPGPQFEVAQVAVRGLELEVDAELLVPFPLWLSLRLRLRPTLLLLRRTQLVGRWG